MKNDKSSNNRLKVILAERQMSAGDLAKLLDLQPQSVRRYVRQGADPNLRLAARMAEVLDCSVDDILAPPSADANKLPVYGAAQGGLGFDITDVSEPIDMIDCPPQLEDANNAYAVYVAGESMSPRFTTGERLLVHPGRPPVSGDYVVVQFSDNQAKHAAVKQFVETTEKELVCAQLNPAEQVKYPLKIVDSIHKIVGVIF